MDGDVTRKRCLVACYALERSDSLFLARRIVPTMCTGSRRHFISALLWINRGSFMFNAYVFKDTTGLHRVRDDEIWSRLDKNWIEELLSR